MPKPMLTATSLLIDMLLEDITDLGWALAYEKSQHQLTKEMLSEALAVANQRHMELEKVRSYRRYA